MKRCSTCNRTFTDPNLRFCIDDGTPLTDVEPDDDATVVTPRNTQDDSWNAVAYQPPRSYAPPGGQVKRRGRAWPWLVGLAGAFILGILVIGIVAGIMAPRIAQRMRQAESNANHRVENSNTAPETNSNTNSTEDIDAPPPTNNEQVLTQLKDIENEWTVANINADKKKLDRILADDFVGQDDQGEQQSKAEYLRTIERNTQIDKWEFSDLQLMLAGDRAVLTGKIKFFAGGRQAAFEFVDKFVWRDGRWQATGSVVKEAGSSGVDL